MKNRILGVLKVLAAFRTLSVPILTLCAWSSSFGITFTVQISPSLYGNVDQYDMSGYNDTECAPASGANGMLYLQNAYGLPLVSNTSYSGLLSVANTMAIYMWTQPDGTSHDDMIEGAMKYVEACAPGKATYSAQDYWTWTDFTEPSWAKKQWPTWSFLYQALKLGDDVQISLSYVGRGHVVTLDGFNWTDTNGDGVIQDTENAQISFIDPLTGQPAQAHLWTWADGSLYVAYKGAATISTAFAISAPEPSAVALSVMGGVGVFTCWVRRRGR